ncbi:CHASE3 domain-containing protein [Aureimonas sp. D3]|uniref:CHASE3 domain-containing protein n=1 Tax=Aureimonas sp. D3 TaxID=1638164 RepID=UPI000781C9B8|nr:CHASE3 domain-containing protein [Aureimonas sp. D3]
MSLLSWSYIRRTYLTRPTLLRVVPTGAVLLTGIVATTWTHSLLNQQRDLVVHTHEVIETTKDVLIGLDDAETGQRGYLLSRDRRYLEPYDRALERLGDLRSRLRQQISDNGEQVSRVDGLGGLIDLKLAEMKDSIALHDEVGFEAARRREIAMMERATMDQIRAVIGAITEGEKSLLSIRSAEVDEDENRVRIVAILIGLASLLTRTGVELYLARKGLDVRIVVRHPHEKP